MASQIDLRVRLDAKAAVGSSQELERAYDRTGRGARDLGTSIDSLNQRLARQAKEALSLNSALGVLGVTLGAAGLARGVTSSVRAFADFEQAMTGVAKTVDISDAELAAMGQRFQQLSTEIPVAANELARVAELAGQLGIAVPNIESFTKTMVALGVSTNMSSEEAATALARLANVMQTPQTQFERLGSAIVALGNNVAATEREIVEFASRVAGAGQIAGLTEAAVLAIGAAMSAVGVEAEAGGTAVQTALIAMNTAVSQGNENLARFAKVAGMSAEEFAARWREDAGETFTAFIEGLGRQGDNAVAALEGLGLANQRTTRAFLSLANAGDQMRRALDIASEGWNQNTALAEEAARFYGTLDAQIKTVGNAFTNLKADIGEALAPATAAGAKALVEAMGFLSENIETVRDVALATSIVFTARLIPALATTTVVQSAQAFASLAVAIRSVRDAAALASIAVGGLSKALALVGGPVGAAVLAVGTATIGMLALYRKRTRELAEAQEELRRTNDALRESLSALGEEDAKAALAQIITNIAETQRQIAELEERRRAIPDVTPSFMGGAQAVVRAQQLAQIDGPLKELKNTLEQQLALFDGVAEALGRVGKATEDAKRATEEANGPTETQIQQSRDLIESLRTQIDEQRRLLAAQREGEDAVLATSRAIARERAERDALSRAIEADREAALAYVAELYDLIEALDDLKREQDEARRAAEEERRALEAAERARREEHEARERTISNLETEVEWARRLAAARLEGAEAVAEQTRQRFIEEQVATLGLDLTKELTAEQERQVERVRALADEYFRLTEGMEAAAEASRQMTAAQAAQQIAGAAVGAGVRAAGGGAFLQAGGAAITAALAGGGPWGAVAAGVTTLLGSLGRAGKDAKEAARRAREAERSWKEFMEGWIELSGIAATLSAHNKRLQEGFRQLQAGLPEGSVRDAETLEEFVAALEGVVAILDESGGPAGLLSGVRRRAADTLEKARDLQEEYNAAVERSIAAYKEDLSIRLLVAQGMDAEAERRRLEIAQRKELESAIATGREELVDLTREVHEAEMAAFEAAQAERERREAIEAAREAVQIEADLLSRQLMLAGDSMGAMRVQLEANAAAELARYEDLFEAGKITADQLAAFADVLDREVADALAKAEAEARRTAEAFAMDIEARRATLRGDDDEAALIRLQMQQADELARAQELLDAGIITTEMFQALADVLEGELAKAIQEAADASKKAAEDLAAAQASFLEDLEVRRLMALGRTDEAERLRMEIRFAKEIADAIAAGFGDEVIEQLKEIHDLERQALEAAEEDKVIRQAQRELRRPQDEAVRNIFAVTETTASGLLELTRSQNVYLAEIAENTRGLRTGIVPPSPFGPSVGPASASVSAPSAGITIHVHVTAQPGQDPHELGWQIGQGVGERLNERLAPVTRDARRRTGTLML